MRNRLGDTWLTTRHVAGGGVRVRVSPGGARLLGFQGNVPIALKHIQNDTNITTAGGCRASPAPHLGMATSPFIHGAKRFPRKPRTVPLLSMAAPKQHQQIVSGPNTPQVSSDLFMVSTIFLPDAIYSVCDPAGCYL